MPFQKVMPWLVESGGIAGIAKCQTFWRAMAGIGACSQCRNLAALRELDRVRSGRGWRRRDWWVS